ncbi:MAG: aminoglycoside adenylyltransferase domain-containing protein [Chloroflexota bacterium]
MHPTQFPDLNHVLAQFVRRVRAILADNIVGIYLQGSFAVGDADEDSDVDVMVVIQEPLPDAIIPTLNRMHQTLFDEIDGYWSEHLEGSYFPASLLRRLTPNQPLLHYFDNGSTSLELSDHDNTLVVRWCMREYGISLYGPPTAELIDEVSEEALKDEIRQVMIEWGEQLLSDPLRFNGRWSQSFAVVSYCRMLHTLATGRVHSKLAGANWAKEHLDSRWHDFIQRAQDNRKGQFLEMRDLNHPEDTTRTPEFLRYAINLTKPSSNQ